MQALVNAFLRLFSFLLPPSWLRLGFCWWVGDECGDLPLPNPRARLKRRKPLTYEEVTAQDSVPAASRPPSCVSLAADSPASPPADFPWGRIWEFWHAVERILGAPFAIRRRWCQKHRTLYPSYAADSGSPPNTNGNPRSTTKDADEPRADTFPTVMSAATESPSSLEPLSGASVRSLVDVISVDNHLQEMGTQVTITVAIQAAEDEEPDEELSSNNLDLHGGSCSEDEIAKHDKSSGAGTSGGELEEESWRPPDPELTQKLIAQIEFYLSDENLEHDAFLLKHVRRNKLGFVSVKLLTSFKKVKHLTRDWRTTAYALRQSTLLELNEEGRKVRRRTTVPVFASESLPSRMLLLSELQRWPELGVALAGGGGAGDGSPGSAQQERLMELLLKAFGAYGPIASVRVLKPGKDLPPDLKKLSARYSQLGTEECAIVEFEEVEAAVRAHEAYLGGDGDGRGLLGLKVVLIGTKPPKKKAPKERPREEAGGGGLRKSRSLNSRVRELQYHGDDSACSSSETESNPTSPRLTRKSRSCNKLSPVSGGPNFHLSPAVSPRTSPWNSPRASPCSQRKAPHSGKSPLASEGRLSPEPGRRWADYSSDSSLTPSGSPWVQRRKQVASQESSPVGSPMLGRKIQNADGLPPGVVRLPRGPDGTRGFHGVSVAERGKAAGTQT
ncbi:LOW QUALITY PROTEIN: la-related protein 6a [Electrophorus electricus]|uniref:LOW QUALITY PROTEIN: la-related protein 6a n=1 Tax=Electrophorus electricus TaxID=8005 RepID=UPI0015D0684A|nr:LOW QUALITY PROTEIN: la-related protein 6a [Electrophorus electricus]